jgi:fructose-1,6-bisphosphatase I
MSDDPVAEIFDAVAAIVPEIEGGLVDRRRKLDSENPSGETQFAADEWADQLFAGRLTAIDGVGEYASEERAEVAGCGDGYAVSVDPLDGSSNLASNNPIGTIVGVYEGSLPTGGSDLVAAAYVVYGSITTMTRARDGSVAIDVIEGGDRRTVESDYELPTDPTVYGFGGGRESWLEPFARYAEEVMEELKLRYSGALVADVNQVLHYGGVFAYPGIQARPEGKLRAQFEAAPIGYVVESAGGRSSDGRRSLVAGSIQELHERTPVAVGSPEYIERLEAARTREVAQ